MGNMRKKIAFLAGAISFDNQNRVIDGVLRRAAEFDTDVFIFTCFVNYDESEENKVGAFQIMELPDLTTYDGVIVMKNSIQYEPASNSLMNRIKESRIPAVSVDEYIDGMHNVGISDYNSQKRIVEHLIKKHHLTKSIMCAVFYRAKKEWNVIGHIGMLWKSMAFLFVIVRFTAEIIIVKAEEKPSNIL